MTILANPTLWRTHPHKSKNYLYIYTPETLFKAQINQSSFIYPISQLTFDNVTIGAYTDIIIDAYVKFTDGSGNIKGYGRIRKTPTSSILYIGHVGENEISFDDNDYIEVLNDFRIQNKIPRDIIYKDYDIAYSDQGSKPNPVCVAGPDRIGFVSGGILSCAFDLTNSYVIAPGATISSFSGTVNGGSIVSGTIASGIFTVEFNSGSYYQHFTVTDSNGKTHTRHVLVAAINGEADASLYKFKPETLRYSEEGSILNLTILQDVSAILSGSLVIMFSRDFYGETEAELNGEVGAKNIKFIGWFSKSENELKPLVSNTKITAIGPSLKLQELNGFSQTTINATSPNNWSKMKSHNLFRHIWYLLHWHSTILSRCDLEYPLWDTDFAGHIKLDASEGTLFNQIKDKAWAVNAKFASDHNGILRLRRYYNMLSDADKAGVDTIVSLTDADWIDQIRISEDLEKDMFWVRGNAFLQSTTKTQIVQSIAPITPSQAKQQDNLNYQLVIDQSDLNRRTGQYFALKNMPIKTIGINLAHDPTVIDPVWQELIVGTFLVDNKRGISFTNQKFIVKEVTITFNDTMIKRGLLTLEPEVEYINGTTVVVKSKAYKNKAYSKINISTAIPIYKPAPNIPIDIGEAPAFYVQTLNHILRTRSLTAVNFEIVLNLSDFKYLGYTAFAFITYFRLDPFNPKNGAYVTVDFDNFAFQHHVTFYINNLDGPPGTQTLTPIFDDNNTIDTINLDLQASINQKGVLFGIGDVSGGLRIYRRLGDYPTAFSILNPSGTGFNPFYTFCIGYKSPAVGSHVGLIGSTKYGNKIYRTVNSFTTISDDYDASPDMISALHIPYANNPDDKIAYALLGANPPVTTGAFLRRSALGVWSSHTITDGVDNFGNLNVLGLIHSYTQDKNYLTTYVRRSTSGHYNIFRSSDEGDNWSKIRTYYNELHASDGTGGMGLFGGWPYSKEILFAFDIDEDKIVYTRNAFSVSGSSVNWLDITGNFLAITGYAQVAAKTITLVPVWVK